jgi:hypothetical protein
MESIESNPKIFIRPFHKNTLNYFLSHKGFLSAKNQPTSEYPNLGWKPPK